MMRALAEFIMRGRLRAAVLALLGIPLITHGTIGLVALRKGPREGLLLIVVALLPVFLAGLLENPSAAHFWGTLLGLLAVYIPALCLRATVSWSFALQVLIVFSLLVVMIAAGFVPQLMEAFSGITALFIAMMDGQPTGAQLPQPDRVAVAGFLGLGMMFNGLTGLLLARWWQALLYNPGGFGSEFRQLRLGMLPSTVCMVVVGLCLLQGSGYIFWASMFAVPLIIVAIAIMHSLVKAKKINTIWLFVFYASVIVFSPLLLVMSVIGFMDSWLNIRSRLSVSE